MKPPYCIRCCQLFTSEQELNSHYLAAEKCPDVPNKPVIEGINKDQEKQLRSKRRKRGVSTEDKWVNVYFILFPGDTEAPSPCKYYLTLCLKLLVIYISYQIPQKH